MENFEELYSYYYDTVYRYVYSLCRNQELAEDITEESFFKALKNIKSFRGDCKINVWLCQIAKNTLYSESKYQKRFVDYPLEIIEDEKSLEQRVINNENISRIHRVIHSLDEPYKEVFWMRTYRELSFAEIGDIFGKTESWARVTYHRAKIKIKEEIK